MKAMMFALLVACSSSSSTPSSTPAPTTTPPSTEAPPSGAALTKEDCEAQGGRVNASIGGGEQAHCNPDETEVGPVRLGIEGGWCCKKK